MCILLRFFFSGIVERLNNRDTGQPKPETSAFYRRVLQRATGSRFTVRFDDSESALTGHFGIASSGEPGRSDANQHEGQNHETPLMLHFAFPPLDNLLICLGRNTGSN